MPSPTWVCQHNLITEITLQTQYTFSETDGAPARPKETGRPKPRPKYTNVFNVPLGIWEPGVLAPRCSCSP